MTHASPTDLPNFLATCWAQLARRPIGTLATIGAEGAPQQRSLMLRAADEAAGTIAMFTDLRTPKMAELRADPRASLLVYLADRQLQLRLSGHITPTQGDALASIWAKLPPEARGNYGVTPAPGTPIEQAHAYARDTDQPQNFAQLTFTAATLEATALATSPHARALFKRADDWRGEWIAP